MALPTTRDTNYAPGMEVESADLDNWQDWIIQNYRGKPGAITPAAISGTVNDYNPTGLDVGGVPSAQVIRLSLLGPTTLNGLAGGVAGRIVILVNIDNGGDYLDLVSEAGGSTAANRFALPAGETVRIMGSAVNEADACAILWYDGTSSRWRLLASSTMGGKVFAAGEHIRLQGAGRYKHDAIPFYISALKGVCQGGNDSWSPNANGYMEQDGAGNFRLLIPLEFAVGKQLDATVRVRQAASETLTAQAYRVAYTDGTRTTVGSSDTSSTGSSFENLALGSFTIESGYFYWVEVSQSAGTSGGRCYGIFGLVSET